MDATKEFSNILRQIQQSNADRERKLLLHQEANLFKLNPFLDSNGLLRVGGRLRRLELPDDFKFPSIAPNDGKISFLIASYYHAAVYHAGRGMMLNEIRISGYWTIKIGLVVRQLISHCTICRWL